MTELPKSLRDAMQESFEEFANVRISDFTGGASSDNFRSLQNWQLKWEVWQKSWDVCHEHLLSQAPEFDEKEATRAYNNIDTDKVMTPYGQSLKLARWQHAQTSAIFEAKLAQKDEEIELWKSRVKQIEAGEFAVIFHPDHAQPAEEFVKQYKEQQQEIERLKAKLGEADMKFEAVKQEAEKRRKSEEKLAARVVELEGVCDQIDKLIRPHRYEPLPDAVKFKIYELACDKEKALRGENE